MKKILSLSAALFVPFSAVLSQNVIDDLTLRIADQPVERDLDAPQTVPNPLLSPEYTDDDVFALMVFDEPLVPLTSGVESPEERAAFAAMINAYTAAIEGRQPAPPLLEAFVAQYPESRWRAALEYNLGQIKYAEAYFTKALAHYQSAHELGKADKGSRIKALSDMALAMWGEMMAKLGRVEEADALVKEGQSRRPGGSAQQLFSVLREAVAVMKQDEPGFGFKCGPFALASARESLKLEPVYTDPIAEAKSGKEGFSFSAVAEIARRSGMDGRVVEVTPGQIAALPVPAVVHWKLGHYAALTEKSPDGTQFRVVDPTFRFDRWVTAAALAEEGSGLYLIFGANPAFAEASPQVAAATYGRGFPFPRDPDQTKECDGQTNSGCGGSAMAEYSIHLMAVSLHIADTPVQYNQHVGPSGNVKIFYNETSTIQPANNNGTSFGNQWSHSWNSYIKVSGTVQAAYTSAEVALREGGIETHTLVSGTSVTNKRGMAKLVHTGTINFFKRTLPNGWVEQFGRARVTASNTYYYLLFVTDEAGNTVTVDYEVNNNVDRITDELGKVVDFKYQHGTDAYKVTSIEDPFGRVSSFAYTTVNGNLQLESITDPVGIVSEFGYGAGDIIDELTTPYGTTTFTGTASGTMDRWIEATDPTGRTERVEYKNDMASLSGSIYTVPSSAEEPLSTIVVANSGTAIFGKTTEHLYDSQMTFHWSKKKWKAVEDLRTSGTLGATAVDFDKATAYRWLRVSPGSGLLSPTLHSKREPLEYRVWFNYPGQTNSDSGYNAEGTSNVPNMIARVVSGTIAQLTQITSNTLGNPTLVIDPLGRRTKYTYASNDLDLTKAEVLVSGTATYDTVFEAAWNADHRPNWIRTASGANGRIDFDWNARGQLTRLENALGEVTNYSYTTGKLTEINPALSGTTDRTTFTYDSAQRVKTRTAWAFTGSYGYDNLDRVTSILYPDATTETWNYQVSGTGGQTLDVWTYKDRLNRETDYIYNGIRQVTSITDPLSRTTAYEWCRCGALQKLTDPKGQITDWKYDIQGRLVEKKIDGSVVQTLAYDPARGLLSQTTDALGQDKVFTYALDNRLTTLDYQNEVVSTPDVTWEWNDRYPRITAMIDATGTTAYGYGPIGTNSANRLQHEILPVTSGSIQYSYDKAHRVWKRQIDGANNAIEIGYDEIGRVYGYVANSGTVGYFYSATNGRQTRTVLTAPGLTLNIGYVDNDPVKPPNLRKLVVTSGSTGVAQLDYAAINAMGRIGQITGSISSVWSSTLEYDAADQLTRANTTGTPAVDNRYTYDLAANVEQWQETTSGTSAYYPYTKDATNFTEAIKKGVTSGTGSPYLTFTKDANGNTTGWSDAISGKSETLTWDAENRLVSVAQSPANKEFVMVYDGRNRLATIEEKLSGVTQKTTRLIWSGMEICEERDAPTGTVLTKYFPDSELQWVGGVYVPSWYYRDHLGSIVETYSGSGALQSQRRFDEWGKMTGTAPGPGVSKKGYTGHYQPEGMDYVMAPYRWYSPTTRGWLSRDPIGESGGVNLYGYVANNPINAVDLLGLCTYGFSLTGPAFGDRAATPEELQGIEATVIPYANSQRRFAPDDSQHHAIGAREMGRGYRDLTGRADTGLFASFAAAVFQTVAEALGASTDWASDIPQNFVGVYDYLADRNKPFENPNNIPKYKKDGCGD